MTVLPVEMIATLRDFDFSAKDDVGKIKLKANNLHADITEKIESLYHIKLFKDHFLITFLKGRHPELSGAALAVFTIVGMYLILKKFFSFAFGAGL